MSEEVTRPKLEQLIADTEEQIVAVDSLIKNLETRVLKAQKEKVDLFALLDRLKAA